jgi:hypothetical protein
VVLVTSAPVIDERVHRTAIIDALNAFEDDLPVYDYGKTSTTLPPIFVMLAIERRYVEPRTSSGLSGRSGWRILFRYVGRSVDEARWAQMKITQALDEVRLSIGGATSTPVRHESTSAIAEDDGRYSGSAEYTYAL